MDWAAGVWVALTRTRTNVLLAVAALVTSLWWAWAVAGLPGRLNAQQACEMSRMWPAYADYTPRMDSPSGLAASVPGRQGKYRLLLYREGYLQPQPDAFPPTGQPALFVPGNAGSYGQVRSVASSSAHQYWSHDHVANPAAFTGSPRPEWTNLTARGIDWWTIDFNEDFSALHGDTLVEQAVFVNEAIAYLRSVYPGGQVKVPLLAHSMGGIVSRLAMALPEHPPNSVDTLVTLSTPHAYPVLAFDDGIARVYRIINAARALPDPPLLISIAGGALDVQVSPDAANVAVSPVWNGESITISSNALPGTWCSVDHLAIMWCDQLRTRVATGFLQSALPGYASQRKSLWLKALGLANGQAPFPPEDETSEGAAGVSEISLDYVPNDSVLSLVTNTAPSTVFQLMPPSPEYALEFPDPFAKYGTPGKGLWHAHLPVAQLRELSIQQVFIERLNMNLGTFMQYAFGPAPTEDTEIAVSDLTSYTRVILPQVDSSLKAYEMTVEIPPRHCLPPTSYKTAFQPFLRASSLSSLDEVWYPSLDVGGPTRFPVALIGRGPLSPRLDRARSGALVELWIDKKAMTGLSAECNERPVRIHLQRKWTASAGRAFMHVRTTLVIVPIIHLALVLVLALLNPKAGTVSLIFQALAPACVASVATLILCDLTSTILPTWSAYPFLSTSTLGLGLTYSGLGLLERVATALLIVLAGTALTLVGAGMLGVLVSLIRLGAKCVPGTAFTRESTQNPAPQNSSSWAWVVFWRTLPSAAVTLAVSLFVPHQVVMVILLLVQLVLVAGFSNRERSARPDTILLYVLFWLVPLRGPALFVWVRNMIFGWSSPAGIRLTSLAGMSETSGDHNPFLVLPFFALVQRSVSHSLRAQRPTGTSTPFSLRVQLGLLLAAIAIVGSIAPYKTYICYDVACILTAAYWAATAQWRPAKTHGSDEGYTLNLDHTSPNQRIELGALSPDAPARSDLPHGLIPPTLPSETDRATAEATSQEKDCQEDVSPEDTKSGEGRECAQKQESKSESELAGTLDPSPEPTSLDALDGAIAAYLDAVDVYESWRERVHTSLSRGFFSLAKARMEVPAAGLGTRIGKDGLDSRARVATVQVRIDTEGETARYRLVKVAPPPPETESDKVDMADQPGKPEKEDKADKADKVEEKNKAAGQARKKAARPLDPLYQFAALPPPALRRAQTQFREALAALVGPLEAEADVATRSSPHEGPGSVLESLATLGERQTEVQAARKI